MNLLQTVNVLVACLGIVTCRDNSKTNKPLKLMPTITHSLINLGKMDISFHINARNIDTPKNTAVSQQRPLNSFIWKPETFKETPCPCNNNKHTSSHPTNILNKLLMSNNLFSSNVIPTNTMACCDSHEEVEETFVFEVGPKMNQNPINSQLKNVLSSFAFDQVNPIRTPKVIPKMRTLDLFLMPLRKELANSKKVELNNKKHVIIDDIQAVGKDKKNELKWMPLLPLQSSSVKKDLTAQEKIENLILNQKDDKEQEIGKTDNKNDEKINQV